MASPGADNVFLSFRGEDTRHSFTDHLYDALKRAGIGTFRDNEEIKRGEELQPEIERAIKEARGSVVVLSEKYATSTWCLDELVLILQQRRECNHFVLPVFYHVDPSDVRKQINTFAIEVKASSKWTDHNVNLWKKALTEVANLAGMELCGSETKFLKKIVDTIYHELDCKEVNLPPNIIGMATRYGEISSWLNRPDVEFLAICGMAGSGKTTLAKYIYNSNWRTYESTSFVEGIGSKCEVPDGLRMLQEQLFNGILGGKRRKIPSVCEDTFKIQEALQRKRSLIVLDDIAEASQLVALLGTGKINVESKIIITTTRKNTDNWFKSTNWRCEDHDMKLLNDDEALELLSRHAFGSKDLREGFKEVAEQAVRYCEGNPLALQVLASSLSEKNTTSQWKSELNILEKDIHLKIQNVLIMGYKSLSLVSEKELFLHIACFFVGKDKDYVVNILKDYEAEAGITSLINRCLLSVSPNNKLMMHRLLQAVGENIVRQESNLPEKRSRVWLSDDSYKILSKGKGSKTMKGLALDMKLVDEEKFAFKSILKTDALQNMDRLKLLQLNFVQLTGSYENFSEELKWLCWLGSNLRAIPSDLFMGNLVAIDMSYSKLEVFELPMVLRSLQILNLTGSHNLIEIRNISRIPHLETLILWNCDSLVTVCQTIGNLMSLTLLNMTGCKNLCKSEQTDLDPEASTSGGGVTEQPTISFPHSLHRLFLKNCNLDCTDSFPLSFSVQLCLQYLNLGNGLFEFLPCYDHLKSLRVLDLSLCSMLKRLLSLPSTLAELYIYYCRSLEEITFQSHRFTLQEFGYKGCINLSEIEGFIKLVHVAKLEENDLGHMKWLKEYQNHEVCLVGDEELTEGRSSCVQMLYEFNIMSTSLPDMEVPNLKSTYVSELSSLSFDVPPPPENRRLKGLDVTFKYTISGVDDWIWFCKISTTNGVNLMYNPQVFGKRESGEVAIWLSYWPIGNTLETGDKVSVSIAVISGLKVQECGVSLVYTDDKAEETSENNVGGVESLGGDLSGFQLSTGIYYLCRRDFFELMEVGRLTPDWFSMLVGDTIESTEVRGWRKTGRPMQLNPSFTELKFVRCIMHGPEPEEIYKITEMSKSSFVDKTVEFTSSLLGETMKASTSSEFSETTQHVQEKTLEKESRMKMNQNMFNSEVELSKFLGSTDVIQDAYRPIVDISSTYQIHTNRSGIKVLSFDCNPDYTNRFCNGEFDLVSSENHKTLLSFISTTVNPKFSINKAAVELFDQLSVELPELLTQVINGPLVVTGRGLGGYLAILYALRHQHAVDLKVFGGSRTAKRPICITFGSPLIGDEPLRRAISERPQWKSCFLNVVATTDTLASFFSSNTLYRPFGNFLFCTESGRHTAFEDEEAIMVVLDAMASSNAGNISQTHDYRDDLSSIRKKILYRGASKLGEFNLNPLRAGVVVQFHDIGLLNDNSHDLIAKTENSQVKMIKKKRIENVYESMKKLHDVKISLTFMEWYMKTQKSQGGYYDNYKLDIKTKSEIETRTEIITHKGRLNQYWKKLVEEKDQMPQKEGPKLRKRWLYGGTNYRRIIEPLDIANYYKDGRKYIANRPRHYQLLEKWLEDDKDQNKPSERKTKAPSLTEDSCFWAHVEEALISLNELKKGDLSNTVTIEQFEVYLLDAIKDFSLSPDVFVEGSSLMKWWSKYYTYKGSSYDSELAQYMKSESYKLYE